MRKQHEQPGATGADGSGRSEMITGIGWQAAGEAGTPFEWNGNQAAWML